MVNFPKHTIPWNPGSPSTDYFLRFFLEPWKTIVLVRIYNQQFQGKIILLVFDFQGLIIVLIISNYTSLLSIEFGVGALITPRQKTNATLMPNVVPSLKLTYPLKIGLPKRKLVFQPSIFRCYDSFREGNDIAFFGQSHACAFVTRVSCVTWLERWRFHFGEAFVPFNNMCNAQIIQDQKCESNFKHLKKQVHLNRIWMLF